MSVTASSTVAEWLDDPVGGALLTEALRDLDVDPATLQAAARYPLQMVVGLSGGALTVEWLKGLERAANNGMSITAPPPRSAREPLRSGRLLEDIRVRDPFILDDVENSGCFLLYGSTDENTWYGPGTGFDAYRSVDLHDWEGPFPVFRPPADFWGEGLFWAPEVHVYRGRCYMFATFTGSDGRRGTQVLVADAPLGPFAPWRQGAVTPRDWQCLDGTFFLDADDVPWIVYCQEWTQVHDGAIWAQRLAQDLRRTQGPPVLLFHASTAPWVQQAPGTVGEVREPANFVTDGPFLLRIEGRLVMLWSSLGASGYAMGIAQSLSGRLEGPWRHQKDPLWPMDGGHGMIFAPAPGELAVTVHTPNTSPHERAVIRRLEAAVVAEELRLDLID